MVGFQPDKLKNGIFRLRGGGAAAWLKGVPSQGWGVPPLAIFKVILALNGRTQRVSCQHAHQFEVIIDAEGQLSTLTLTPPSLTPTLKACISKTVEDRGLIFRESAVNGILQQKTSFFLLRNSELPGKNAKVPDFAKLAKPRFAKPCTFAYFPRSSEFLNGWNLFWKHSVSALNHFW